MDQLRHDGGLTQIIDQAYFGINTVRGFDGFTWSSEIRQFMVFGMSQD